MQDVKISQAQRSLLTLGGGDTASKKEEELFHTARKHAHTCKLWINIYQYRRVSHHVTCFQISLPAEPLHVAFP